jgi:hypothetical protein
MVHHQCKSKLDNSDQMAVYKMLCCTWSFRVSSIPYIGKAVMGSEDKKTNLVLFFSEYDLR